MRIRIIPYPIVHERAFCYRFLPFGLWNSPATFQREALSIFVELVHDTVEIFMDDLTPYGKDF